MPFVRSIAGVRPTPRYDAVPFTIARMQEAAASTGPWVTVETFDPLNPVEPDPAEPIVRNFTTDAATLEEGWYRVQFADAAANTFETDPVSRGGTVAFAPSEVRAQSELLQDLFPVDPFDAAVEQSLEDKVATAVALIEELLCGMELDGLEGNRRWVALRAVVLKTEQLGVRSASKQRRRSIRSGNLKSISAGPWSESYFGPDEAVKAKMLDSDPELHEALWALADEDCRDRWLLLWGGQPKPAAAVQAFDYRRLPGGYGTGRSDWG